MKFFGKLFKYLLILILLGLLLGMLTAVSWWMRWPVGTGCAIVAGLSGAVLLFLSFRKLWRWRNRKAFVASVLARQKEDGAAFTGGDPLSSAWAAGRAYLAQSRLRHMARASLPCFLALDDAAAGPYLFAAAGNSIPPAREQTLLRWHFFQHSIVLQFHADDSDSASWENLLGMLTEHRRDIRFRGVLLTISADSLLAGATEGLHARAQRLRGNVQQLMLAFNRILPVHVLITGLETIPGMAALLERLPRDDRDAMLGGIVDSGLSPHVGVEALRKALARLRHCIDKEASRGTPPAGNDLRALEELAALAEPLERFLNDFSGSLPHQAAPELRSICLAQEPAGQSSGGSFLHAYLLDFLSHDTAAPRPLGGGLSLYAATGAYCYAALLLCTLGICGIMAVSSIYQARVIREYASPRQENIGGNPAINSLHSRMMRILAMEKEHRAWLLPSPGQDVLGRTIAVLKAQFAGDVFSTIITPAIRGNLAVSRSAPGQSRQDASTMEMLWYIGLMADKIKVGHVNMDDAARYPLTAATEKTWTVYTGSILANAIEWAEDTHMLRACIAEMRRAVASLTCNADFLTKVAQQFDSNNEARRICVSQYWNHLPLGDEADFCVPPHMTVHGLRSIEEKISDIGGVAGDNPELKRTLAQYRDRYLLAYADAWKVFITSFDRAWQSNLQRRIYTDMGSLRDFRSLPHIRLMLDLDKQLAPLLDEQFNQPWIRDFPLLHAMTQAAVAYSGTEDVTPLSSIITLLVSAPDILTRLHAEAHSAARLRKILLATESLHRSFTDAFLTLRTISNTADALGMARAMFAASRQNKAGNSDPYALARQELRQALETVSPDRVSPLKNIFIGMLDFVGQGVIVQAANELQDIWEMEILANPANLYSNGDTGSLYGEKGIVSEFVHTRLAPFIKRTPGGIIANVWNDIPFPFTEDFLTSLSRAEQVAAAPARDEYVIMLRSSPTLVNVDATLRPDMTVLTLRGDREDQTLTNRNYPRQQAFTYRPKEHGETVLELRFPSFTLRQTWPTFIDFLENMKGGDYIFTPEDFPTQAERLARAGIREITVRILADNAAEAIHQVGQEPPVLQKRITYTW